MTLHPGENLASRTVRERNDLLAIAGIPDCADRPIGFMGHFATPSRNRDLPVVRPSYCETGLDGRVTRARIDLFAKAIARRPEALICIGDVRAPVLLSTVRASGLTEAAFR